ncbi:MAG TPA: hypothetical protein VK141_08475 [Nitrosomonas sp.]|nr:hypothetical protein [Nitrosomonas sp.]
MATRVKKERFYLSVDVYDTLVAERAQTDRSKIYILGKNDKGVCVTLSRLPQTGGCGYFAGTGTYELTKAMLSLAKQGLVVGGIVNIATTFSGVPGWHNSIGNAPYEQPGVPIFTFNSNTLEVSLFTASPIAKDTPRTCATAKNRCSICIGCGRASFGKLTHHDVAVVPSNFDPAAKKPRAPRKTKTTTSKKEVKSNGNKKNASAVRKTDAVPAKRNSRRRIDS